MPYIYEKVKEEFKRCEQGAGDQIQGWTPNKYRCIVIGMDYIFYGYHLYAPKMIKLVRSKVEEDIEWYKQRDGRYTVHYLLLQRQLSCLEEIYLDVAFRNSQAMFNLYEFAEMNFKRTTRLRAFGYADTEGLKDMLVTTYKNANSMYAMYLDEYMKGMLKFVVANNKDWYKKYNLRPTFYKLDEDDSSLAKYFKQQERIIGDMAKASMVKKIDEVKRDEVAEIIQQDIAELQNIGYLSQMLNLLNQRSEKDEVGQAAYRAAGVVVRQSRVIEGLSPDYVLGVIQERNLKQAIMKAYKMYRVLDGNSQRAKVDGSTITEDRIRKIKERGFL